MKRMSKKAKRVFDALVGKKCPICKQIIGSVAGKNVCTYSSEWIKLIRPHKKNSKKRRIEKAFLKNKLKIIICTTD